MKKITYTVDDWITAYKDSLAKIGKKYYRVNASQTKMFKKVLDKYPSIEPKLFMEAIFPPRTEWWMFNKKEGAKWIRLEYPYVTHLLSKKAIDTYNRLLPLLKRTDLSTVEEKLAAKTESAYKHIKKNKIALTNFEELWDGVSLGFIPLEAVVLLPNFYSWVCSAYYSSEITYDEFWKALDCQSTVEIERLVSEWI